MPAKCCEKIRLNGAKRPTLNQIYTVSNATGLLNNRPLYTDEDDDYDLWFDGAKWVIAKRDSFNNAAIHDLNYEDHVFKNDAIFDCPTDNITWSEHYDGWFINNEAAFVCIN